MNQEVFVEWMKGSGGRRVLSSRAEGEGPALVSSPEVRQNVSRENVRVSSYQSLSAKHRAWNRSVQNIYVE